MSLDHIDVVHRNSSLIPPGDDDADHNVKTGVPSFDQQDELWLARGIEVRFKLDGKIGFVDTVSLDETSCNIWMQKEATDGPSLKRQNVSASDIEPVKPKLGDSIKVIRGNEHSKLGCTGQLLAIDDAINGGGFQQHGCITGTVRLHGSGETEVFPLSFLSKFIIPSHRK